MPTPFPLIGHEQPHEALLRDLDTGNVAHAYLFAGPAHVGKRTAAKWFAAELLSRGSGEDPLAVADRVARLLHPDLLVLDQLWMEDVSEDPDLLAKSTNVSQEHRRKAKAKTDTIGIDDVRAIQDRLIETGLGTYRCCIIRSVERMQDEAVNALLKILEEPPPGVVFILTTQVQNALLPTLVSRSRVVTFARLSQKSLAPLVKGLEDEEAAFLLRLSQGAPGVVQRLRHDPDSLRVEQAAFAAARSFWASASLSERLRLLAPLSKRDAEAERLLLHLSLALRELLPAESSALAPLSRLIDGWQTNTSGQLLAQRFALELSA